MAGERECTVEKLVEGTDLPRLVSVISPSAYRCDKTVFNRVPGCLSASGELKLFKNIVDMVLDGLDLDIQADCDFLIA